MAYFAAVCALLSWVTYAKSPRV